MGISGGIPKNAQITSNRNTSHGCRVNCRQLCS